MRVVSLVPSTTDAIAALGAADVLVGVTDFCVHGAPDEAARVGGTKNPDVETIVGLAPDLVLANTEENRAAELDALREAGLRVVEQFPRTVADVPGMLRGLGEVLGVTAAAESAALAVESARRDAMAAAPSPRVMALTLVWRKPWMAAGPDTYVDALLADCGFGNVLAGHPERYPKLEEGLVLGADVVLLPSEPYAFGSSDHEAVRRLVGDDDVRLEHVDGELLTWHGPRTAEALRTFSELACSVAAAGGRR